MPKVVELKAPKSDSDANVEVVKQLRESRLAALILPVEKSNGAGAAGAAANPNATNVNDDPFKSLSDSGKTIEPPFDLLVLAMLPEKSSELNQCIEAMVTNIDGTGHRYVSRLRLDDITPQSTADSKTTAEGVKKPASQLAPEQEKLAREARAEKVRLVNFFTYSTVESFDEFRQRLRRDYETTGNAYFEVLRNTNGDIQGFNHIPSYQMRLGRLENEARLVDRDVLKLEEDGSVSVDTVKEWKRFRGYVQSRYIHRSAMTAVQSGDRVVWYKEFGDARKMNKRTGDFNDATKDADLATEVVHMRHYSSRTPYGLPRYIGNLLGIYGDRAAEEINYTTFKNNNIPSMAVCVSNGQLTEGTIKRIESFVESQIRGSSNYSKFLIIEGETLAEEGEDGGQVKIEIRPLVDNQHKDALFQEYSKGNQDKIRRAFRLPPIFVGRSDDYSRSTAESSRRLADEQVFAPEREKFDAIMNRYIFPSMGIRYHKFKSNSPNTTDNQQLVKILSSSEKTGGMTPRIAREMLEQILGVDLPELPDGFPQDVPFSLTMAEAVKNKADPAEPGQQVTALKAIEMLTGGDLDVDDDDDLLEVAKKLIAANRAAESLWRQQVEG